MITKLKLIVNVSYHLRKIRCHRVYPLFKLKVASMLSRIINFYVTVGVTKINEYTYKPNLAISITNKNLFNKDNN